MKKTNLLLTLVFMAAISFGFASCKNTSTEVTTEETMEAVEETTETPAVDTTTMETEVAPDQQ